jgi:hypothetical protein
VLLAARAFSRTVDEEDKAIGAQLSQPARAPIVRSLTKSAVTVDML